ncbi:hypothetical protein HDU67_001781 [Dinochytrium kinnereticum]|nr:hypothetical protein HDU67_001781 [Dinochytrium kinnereticum]
MNDDEYESPVAAPPIIGWTKEETRAVLKFYGLRTLDVQTWEEEDSSPTTSKQRHKMRNRMSAGITHSAETTDINMAGDDPDTTDFSDPLGIKSSILKGKRRAMQNPSTQKLLISNKNFEPAHFLKTIHTSTSYRDLDTGAKNLKLAIEKRTDVIKQLVKQHFAKFVNAKTTIDSLTEDASTLYSPLLERRAKADRLRVALGVLEQWKFFFNLPSVLQEGIKKGNYDAVVRDYNKGKYLMESSFSDASASEGNKDNIMDATDAAQNLLPKNHRKVFDKVWAEVEKTIAAFKNDMFQKLDRTDSSLEAQERIMTHLVELSADKDPVWYYLTNQYNWIISQLKSVYTSHIARVEAIMAIADMDTTPELSKAYAKTIFDDSENENYDPSSIIQNRARDIYCSPEERVAIKVSSRLSRSDFKTAISTVQSKEYEIAFAEDLDLQLWKAALKLVKAACNIMRGSLQDFWRLSRIYSEDRIQKTKMFEASEAPNTKPKRRADIKKMMQCQTMLRNVTDMYTSIISSAFFLKNTLSEIHQAARQQQQSASENRSRRKSSVSSSKPFKSMAIDITLNSPAADATLGSHLEQLPLASSSFLASHPLTCCNFAVRLMGEFVRCFDEIRSMRVGGGTTIEERVLRAIGDTADSVKKRVTEAICDGIVFESRRLYEYEDWSFDPDPRSNAAVLEKNVDNEERLKHTEEDEAMAIAADATQLLKLFYRFMKFSLRCLERVVTAPVSADLPGKSTFGASRGVSAIFFPGATDLIDTTIAPVSSASKGLGTSSGVPEPPAASRAVPLSLLEKVSFAFSESCLGLLDGMEWLATRWTVTEEEDEDLLQALERLKMQPHRKLDGANFLLIAGEDDIGRRQKGNVALLEKKRKAIDTRKIDSRALVILCNLAYLKNIVVPKLVALVELKYRTSMANEVQILNDAVNHLDYILFNNYIRRKSLKISSLIRYGILYSGLDFNDLARLQEIRPYCYDTLMIFVLAHSEVSDASRRLIRRVISQLLQILAHDLLSNFRQIDKFGVAGKMQATLETEFLHQTLAAYENPRTSDLFRAVYTTIENSAEKIDSTPPELIESVEEFLSSAKEATAMQFLCFRDSQSVRTRSGKEAEGRPSTSASIGR